MADVRVRSAVGKNASELLGQAASREYTLDWQALGMQQRDLSELEELFSEEEVWQVIRDMPTDRAPGPDGFIGVFYQKAWGIIKKDIMDGILKLAVGEVPAGKALGVDECAQAFAAEERRWRDRQDGCRGG